MLITNSSVGSASQGVTFSGSVGAPKQTEMGVSSSLKELNEEVLTVCKNAQSLREALGIQQPESGNAAITGGDLASLLRGLLYSLRAVNGDLTDCLRHLNS